jgi:hypothetical protein
MNNFSIQKENVNSSVEDNFRLQWIFIAKLRGKERTRSRLPMPQAFIPKRDEFEVPLWPFLSPHSWLKFTAFCPQTREFYWFQTNFCFKISLDFQFSRVAFTVVNERPTSGSYEKSSHLYGTLNKNCYFLSICQQAGETPLLVNINGIWTNIWHAMPVLSKSETHNGYYFSSSISRPTDATCDRFYFLSICVLYMFRESNAHHQESLNLSF